MKIGPIQKHHIMGPLNDMPLGCRVTWINEKMVLYDTAETIRIYLDDFMVKLDFTDIMIDSLELYRR